MKKFLLAATLLSTSAHAFDCPDANPCRQIILNDAEVNILLGDKGILQTAAQARSLDLSGASTYFQAKIANAERGKPTEAKPEPPKAN